MSPITVAGPSKGRGAIILFFIKAHHHTLTCDESRPCLATWGFSLPHMRQLCLLTVPHTWNVTSSEKHSLSRLGLVLSMRESISEAFRHSSLLQRTWTVHRDRPRCELAKASVKCFVYSLTIVRGHRTLWWPTLSQDTSCLFRTLASKHHISVNRCCVVGVHLINLVSNIDIWFQLCRPHNAISFLPHGKHLFIWTKMGRNSANAARISLEDEQAKETEALPH
jgi:hypothetical protein